MDRQLLCSQYLLFVCMLRPNCEIVYFMKWKTKLTYNGGHDFFSAENLKRLIQGIAENSVLHECREKKRKAEFLGKKFAPHPREKHRKKLTVRTRKT